VAAGVLVLTGCTRQVQPEPDVLIMENPRATPAYGAEVLTLRSPALEHFSADPWDYAWWNYGVGRVPAWRACMHGGRLGDRVCRPGWVVPELPQNDNRDNPVDDGQVLARNELTRLMSVEHDGEEITANRYQLHLRQLRFAARDAGLSAEQTATLIDRRVAYDAGYETRNAGIERRETALGTSSRSASTTQASIDRAAATRSADNAKPAPARSRTQPVVREISPD
jgi:hypothetical protein